MRYIWIEIECIVNSVKELTDELKKNSLAIKNILKGDIISVDYVIGKSGLLFCEANTNAGFASFNYLGYPMREIFISYIKKELSK